MREQPRVGPVTEALHEFGASSVVVGRPNSRIGDDANEAAGASSDSATARGLVPIVQHAHSARALVTPGGERRWHIHIRQQHRRLAAEGRALGHHPLLRLRGFRRAVGKFSSWVPGWAARTAGLSGLSATAEIAASASPTMAPSVAFSSAQRLARSRRPSSDVNGGSHGTMLARIAS